MAIGPKLCRRLQSLQRRIEALYGLEAAPGVCPFVSLDYEREYETVLVKESSPDAIELLVVLPGRIDPDAPARSDGHLQLIEGVSHFVHLSERARTELPTTHLELELQAEVDKFALLADDEAEPSTLALHRWLFERATFLHAADTSLGQRYRLANDLAARLWSRLVKRNDRTFTLDTLRRFYRLGQAGKLSLIAGV